jgi:hypothetical protein
MAYSKMSGRGKEPGDMNPTVDDYQPKMDQFAGEQNGKTTMYVEKRDRIQASEAKMVKRQDYKGRYD